MVKKSLSVGIEDKSKNKDDNFSNNIETFYSETSNDETLNNYETFYDETFDNLDFWSMGINHDYNNSFKNSNFKFNFKHAHALKSFKYEEHLFTNFLDEKYFDLFKRYKKLIIYLYNENLLTWEHIWKNKIEKYSPKCDQYRASHILNKNYLLNSKNKKNLLKYNLDNIFKIGFNVKVIEDNFNEYLIEYNISSAELWNILKSIRIIIGTTNFSSISDEYKWDLKEKNNFKYEKITFNILIIDPHHLFILDKEQKVNPLLFFNKVKDNKKCYFDIFN